MEIRIRRLGGFAGLDQTIASLDSDRLPKASADRLSNHLAQLSSLGATAPESKGADQFRYEIEVSEKGTPPRVLSVIDEGDPKKPAMKHLSALLNLAGVSP
jgi:hypothetical protein